MLRIACFGDSLVQGFPFGNKYSWINFAGSEKITLLNYGLCGDCSDDILDRMQRYPLPEDVKHIIYLGGANDVLQAVPLDFTMEVYKKLLSWCRERDYRLLLVLPLLSGEEALNRKLINLRQAIKVSLGEQVQLLDLQPALGEAKLKEAYLDGVHPKAAVYEAMGVYARPLVKAWAEEE